VRKLIDVFERLEQEYGGADFTGLAVPDEFDLAFVGEEQKAVFLSQEAFAEKAGLGYKYYQHVESGRRRDIRLSTLEKLAKACGVKLWELLDLDDEASTVLADDVAKNDSRPTPARPARKAPKPKARKKAD